MKIVRLSFLVALLILFKLQSPYLFGGDSAEYSLIAESWSIAHPPGYPFYSFLINIAHSFLPFLPNYIQINLFSIIPTIIVSLLIYVLINDFLNDKFIALATSILYIFLFPIWLYSELPEVFSLNNLIIILITYFILKYRIHPEKRIKYLLFFLMGLIFVHHHTAIIFLPGWYFLLHNNLKKLFKDLKKSLFYFFIALSFYLYAPIVSLFNPPIDYENVKTFQGLLRLFTRTSYGTFRAFVGSSTNFLSQIYNAFSVIIYILQDFRTIGFVFILMGIFWMYKKNKIFFKFILVSILFQLFFLFYTSFPTTTSFIQAIFERFLIPLYLLLIFPFAYGLDYLKNKIQYMQEKFVKNNLIKKFIGVFIYLLAFCYIFVVFYSNYQIIKYVPKMKDFDILAENILDTVPKNSILTTSSDSTTFSVYYYYYAKKYRQDVKIVHLGLLPRDYYQKKLKKNYNDMNLDINQSNLIDDFISKNAQKYGYYAETPQTTGVWLPYGLLWKYYPNQEKAQQDISNVIRINEYYWTKIYKIPNPPKKALNILHLAAIRENYLGRLMNYTDLLIKEKQYDKAVSYLKTILNTYDQNNQRSIASLMKIYSVIKNCTQASIYQKKFLNSFDSNDIDKLTQILYYYYYCDSKNPKVDQYLNQYNNIRNRENVPLKNI